MKRILVPTDFSPNAEFALRVAIDIASRAKGTIILYHVYGPVESPFINDKISRKEYNIQTETIILKRLQRLRKKVLQDGNNVIISTVIGHFPLINNILGFAEQNQIDLIVMGTKGAGGIRKIIIGSVAARIAQKTDIPVLLIPNKFKSKELKQIVFASDFHPSDRHAISFTLAFSKLYHGTVKVVHLIASDASEKKSLKERADFGHFVNSMQDKFDNENLEFQLLEIAPEHNRIETLYKEIAYDILAMVRGKRTFLQKISSASHTQSMAFMTKKPLLIMPPEDSQPDESI